MVSLKCFFIWVLYISALNKSDKWRKYAVKTLAIYVQFQHAKFASGSVIA